MFDLIFRNGTIIDGTKAPRFTADVGLRGDRIAAIGDLRDAPARESIDASGRVVAPGFIDVHNHSDGWLLRTPHLTSKTLQGFTTEVLMADGISYAPVNEHTAREWLFYLRALNSLRLDEYRGWRSIAEYLAGLAGRNVQNAAAHVPYANVRSLSCGFGRQPVDDCQMRLIQAEIHKGMADGAVGLSTGLDYIVQCFSTTDELVAACSAVAEFDGLYVTHIRYKLGLLEGLQEAVDIARRAGVRLHISHLKAVDDVQPDELLAFLEQARREVDLSFDAYPYQSGCTFLSALLPYEIWEDGPTAAMGKLRDPVLRRRFADGMNAHRLPLDKIHISWLPGKENSPHQGKLLSDYVAETGLPPEDALADLLLEERMAILAVYNEGEDEEVLPLLGHDLQMMGTDGIHAEGGVIHPRQFGSVGRFLGPCVRDHQLFSLEEAVWKLSGFPADRFRLRQRGVLQEAAWGDVVVFDPATITDRATYQDPQRTTVGVEHVAVNGTLIVRDGAPVEGLAAPLPGRALQARES